MAVVRELVTKLEFKANLRPLNRALDRVKKLKAGFSKFILGPAGIIGGVLTGAATAMFAFVNSVASGLDETAKLAKQLSISAGFLQEMGFAAELSGASQQEFGVAIRTVSRNILEAQRGLETYEKAFRELGINVKDTDGELRSIEDLLPEIADAFKNTIPDTEKTGRALELFGRSGAKLLPLLNQGSKGIEKMRKEARKLGIVFGDQALVEAEAFKDEMLRFQSTIKAVGRSIGVAFLPDMRAMVETFRKFAVENRKLIKTAIIGFLEKMAFFAGIVAGVFLSLGDIIGSIVEKFSSFTDEMRVALEFFGILKKDAKSTRSEIDKLTASIDKQEKSLARTTIGGKALAVSENRLRINKKKLIDLLEIERRLRIREAFPERLPPSAQLLAAQKAVPLRAGIGGGVKRQEREREALRRVFREVIFNQVITQNITGDNPKQIAVAINKALAREAQNALQGKLEGR